MFYIYHTNTDLVYSTAFKTITVCVSYIDLVYNTAFKTIIDTDLRGKVFNNFAIEYDVSWWLVIYAHSHNFYSAKY